MTRRTYNSDIVTIADLARAIYGAMSRGDRDVLEEEMTFGSPTLDTDLGMLLEDHRITPTRNRVRSLKRNLKRILAEEYGSGD